MKAKTLKFTSNYQKEEIALKDIKYIEAFKHKCYIYVKNIDEPLSTCSTLSELHSQLDKTFIKVNRSCIVSMNFIKSMADGVIKLNNNIDVQPSFIQYNDIFRAFNNFQLSKNKISTPIAFVQILFDERNVPSNIVIEYKDNTSLRLEGVLSFSI